MKCTVVVTLCVCVYGLVSKVYLRVCVCVRVRVRVRVYIISMRARARAYDCGFVDVLLIFS